MRKKQQKSRSLQRQRSIQSDLSDGSDVEAAPPKVSDSQVKAKVSDSQAAAQPDSTMLQREDDTKKDLDSYISAAFSTMVAQMEQRELQILDTTTEQNNSVQGDNRLGNYFGHNLSEHVCTEYSEVAQLSVVFT